MVTVLCGLVR